MNNKLAFLALPVCLALAGASVASDSLGWISGHWCAGSEEDLMEEVWLPPHGGVMIGMSRSLRDDRTVGFEYLRITVVDDVWTYIAQPGGRPPTSFVRADGGDNWVRFENREHDFPQRIEYRREGDLLTAIAAGPSGNNDEAILRFEFRPCHP